MCCFQSELHENAIAKCFLWNAKIKIYMTYCLITNNESHPSTSQPTSTVLVSLDSFLIFCVSFTNTSYNHACSTTLKLSIRKIKKSYLKAARSRSFSQNGTLWNVSSTRKIQNSASSLLIDRILSVSCNVTYISGSRAIYYPRYYLFSL